MHWAIITRPLSFHRHKFALEFGMYRNIVTMYKRDLTHTLPGTYILKLGLEILVNGVLYFVQLQRHVVKLFTPQS